MDHPDKPEFAKRLSRVLGLFATLLSVLSAIITIFAFATGIGSVAALTDHWNRKEDGLTRPTTEQRVATESRDSSSPILKIVDPLFTGLTDGAYSPAGIVKWRFPPYGRRPSSPAWYYAGIYIGIGGVMGVMALLAYASARFEVHIPRTAR